MRTECPPVPGKTVAPLSVPRSERENLHCVSYAEATLSHTYFIVIPERFNSNRKGILKLCGVLLWFFRYFLQVGGLYVIWVQLGSCQ